MAPEQAADSVVILATPEVVAEATLDFESYPVWARSIRSALVKERDHEGRPSIVAFEAAALGWRVHYTLRYDYAELPMSYSWDLVEGDPKLVEGGYYFDDLGSGRTRVTYCLLVDLGIPLPGFVLRRAERLVLSLALKELKAYVET